MIGKRTSVAVIVVTSLVAVTTLLSALLGWLAYQSIRSQQFRILKVEQVVLAQQLSAALLLPARESNHEQVEQIIEGALKDTDVAGVSVRLAAGGGTDYARTRDENWNVRPGGVDVGGEGLMVEQRDISAGNRMLGTVTVYTTPRFSEERLRKTRDSMISTVLMVDAVLVLSLYLLLSAIVLKPLREIERYASSVTSGSHTVRIDERRFLGELESLRRSIGSMTAQLEQRVEERTEQLTLANRELEAANEQLESFSYSVSHDLRGPLRHINAFAKLLLERARGLDPAERGYLETIAMSSQWMGGLVDDLLSLARATRADFHPARLDLQALVESAREQCLREVSARHIEWKIGELPEVEGDWTLLKSAFVNLLENAVKFTRPRDPAIIEVGARPGEDGQVVVYVKDNGVGFDMDYADKLFGVFQRMHGQDEFEGTGVGLATVQRIVARHGGQVWAEAAPGSGATFFVALSMAAAPVPAMAS